MRKRLRNGKTTITDLALIIHEVLDIPLNKNTKYPSEGAKILKIILESVKKALQSHDTVYVKGFGKFIVKKSRERRHLPKPIIFNTPGQYNPIGTVQSDEPTWVPGKYRVYFRPSLQLTAMLNADNPNVHERTRAIPLWDL